MTTPVEQAMVNLAEAVGDDIKALRAQKLSLNEAGGVDVSADGYRVGGLRVVGPRLAALAALTGSAGEVVAAVSDAVIDASWTGNEQTVLADCRTAIGVLVTALNAQADLINAQKLAIENLRQALITHGLIGA